MSHDLLSEFDSFYSAPVPEKSPTSIQNFPNPPSTSQGFTTADPLNLGLPPAPRQQRLPLHNVPLVPTASRTHQHRVSATNFDDILAYVNNPQAPWPPKPSQLTGFGQTQRPVSLGPLPSSNKIDLFEALGSGFSGSDGRGGRFTPPPPRPVSRNDYNVPRKTTPVPQQRGGVGVSGFGGFSTPTPLPDLLGMLDNEQEESEDNEDFGDFTSASLDTTAVLEPAPVPVLTPAAATPPTTFNALGLQSSMSITPGDSFEGIQQYGDGSRNSGSTPPAPASMSRFRFPSTTNHTPGDSFSGLQQDASTLRSSIGTPAPAPTSGFGFPLTTNITPPRKGLSGVQHNGSSYRRSMGGLPAPPTLPRTNSHTMRISVHTPVDDDDDFGEFMTSPVTPAPPSRNIPNTPPPYTFNTSPPTTFPNTNHRSITLRSFVPSHPPTPKKKIEEGPIPPVSVLLTAFPPLFLLPQTHLLDKLTPLPFPLRQRILSHPKTREFLEGVCELGRVAGRIIAGRKRRVKSTIPSSRNRAGSRGSGGIKLDAGSKSNWEQQKEEREVKETCRLWGNGAGRLKAAMGAGVPDLVDEVERSKVVCGCRLCGLGKKEVIIGLKEQTERIGWWDAGWGGHGGCRGFWERHGRSLSS